MINRNYNLIAKFRTGVSVLGECPLCRFTHHIIQLVGSTVQKRNSGCFQAGIAQRDRDIAAEALVFCPQDGCAGVAGFELRFREQERFEQVGMRVKKLVMIEKGGQGFCFLVGGADGLASVTAENTLPHQRAKGGRDGSAVLDREVGKAAAGVYGAVWEDRLGGASHLAAMAIGTVGFGQRFVRF